MSSNERDIGSLRTGIVFGDILLYSKSKLDFVSGFYSARTLSDRLTPNCMLNNAKVRHVFSEN